MTDRTTDEARWAEAQSILDRAPTESAAERLRRSRRNRWLLVAGFVLVGLTVALLLAVFVFEPRPDREDPPVWRAVTGLVVGGLGLLLMLAALVVQIRGLRRVGAWRSPLHVLTFGQRKELVRQVRGQVQDVPERVGLARHLAETLLVQRLALPVQAGLLVSFVGLWIADRETYRLVLAGVLGVALVFAALAFRRDARRAHRFLDEHPEPAGG